MIMSEFGGDDIAHLLEDIESIEGLLPQDEAPWQSLQTIKQDLSEAARVLTEQPESDVSQLLVKCLNNTEELKANVEGKTVPVSRPIEQTGSLYYAYNKHMSLKTLLSNLGRLLQALRETLQQRLDAGSGLGF